ncbi:hypothetical protein CDV55_103613 [Aspergillus turcosus]|nr:hypothetical protein CDV55_103613 [Aspergillus turcosus]
MLNQRTLNVLHVFVREDPEVNLLSVFPPNYGRRYRLAAQSSINPLERKMTKPRSPQDFQCSDPVETILRLRCRANGRRAVATWTTATTALEFPKAMGKSCSGVVVNCDDDIVAKVVVTSGDYTEYTTLQYLAERAPEIPVPKPHGLIRTGLLCVIFMTYIPSMTLTEAWPTLTHQGKVSVQRQLDDIFCQLRTLQKDDYYLECVEGKESKNTQRVQ